MCIDKLQLMRNYVVDWNSSLLGWLLPWETAAADLFVRFRREGIRIGTMDLKIACIALVHDATLLTQKHERFCFSAWPASRKLARVKTMTEFHKIWIEQFDAAEGIKERFGVQDAALPHWRKTPALH
jgi:hypothetical protein